MYDAIIVGGSFAGISAGLQLARARRNVLVIDGGKRRNRFAATSHGFLGHDGRAPGDIVGDGREELYLLGHDWHEGADRLAGAPTPTDLAARDTLAAWLDGPAFRP